MAVWIGIITICGLFFISAGIGLASADVGNASAADRVAPTQFDTDEGDMLWEFNVDLESYSEPIVVDGILVTIADGDGSSEQVVAYDIGTGEQRWAMDISARELTAADGTIYATGDDGVHALALELGTVEWHAEFDARGGVAVGDGTVYAVERISASRDQLTALDAETGDEEWSEETDEILSGPTVIDGTVYVVNSGGMIAFDADGEEEWQWNAEENIDIANGPTVADGHVYVSHSASDDDPGLVSAVDTDGERVWQEELGVAQEALATVPAPTVAAENNEPTVYVGYDGLYALDPANDNERWSDGDAVFDAPTVADGTLFVPQTTDSEAFRALDPNNGTELWSVDTGDRSEVVVVDGVAYVAVTTGDRSIMAIDAGVAGSSSDSRVMLGGHHHEWTGKIPDAEPRVVDATFDEGVLVEDELTVSATARNDWNPSTSATYTLEFDGTEYDETIEVPAFGTNTVDFTVAAPSESGEYSLEIDGEEIGTLTVVDETDPVFRSVNPFFDTQLEGDLIQIPYNATNLGDTFVEENATLALEGPAFDGREDVAFAEGQEGLEPDETALYLLITDPIDEPGEYTAFLEDEEIGTIEVLPEDEPIYLSDSNRLHDSIISGIEAPVEPSAAGEASVDVRYENLGEDTGSVESELVAYDDEGTEAANVTKTIEVEGESSTTARLSVPLAEPGVYDLEVDGKSVGEVEVLVDGVQDGDSIQEAIDAAPAGDTIFVGNGTYEESLTIDKEFTLRSVSDGGAVLDGSGEEFERAMTVADDDVTVEGFRIEGYSASGQSDGAVYVEGDRFEFQNNTITDSVDAIHVDRRINEFQLVNNHIHDNEGTGIDLQSDHEQFTIDSNKIERNGDGILEGGALGTSSNDGTIGNNTIADNDDAGIKLSTGSDNLIFIELPTAEAVGFFSVDSRSGPIRGRRIASVHVQRPAVQAHTQGCASVTPSLVATEIP
ncbi:Cell surface protein (plasmid) [Natrarchaeobaculum sulfurireducens]|uniref:Cell surface protein n=1 Tax=Natrarchaeobaculum sulfurireducens TaxID=2044521 RepID=A0A346PK43_9EURY|nr:Cell surface protein [Natrarchaeobaculum sulfurireducens]